MPPRILLLLIVSLGWGAPTALPQASPGVDPQRLSGIETAILRHRSRLDLSKAIDALGAALDQACADTERSADPRVAALAELQVITMVELAAGFADPRRLHDHLARLAAGRLARRHPVLRDTLLLELMHLNHQTGERQARESIATQLGLIRDWWILGGLDNERGAGHARAHDAERSFEPDRDYRGKKRAVRWRQPAVPPIGGRIELGAMLRPTRQVLGFAATCVEAEQACEVVLHLGSCESFKVFLNGVAVGGREVRRPFRFDQDVVVLPLQPGANRLVLKIGAQDADLLFAARLRTPRGAATTGITIRADRAAMLRANQTQPRQLPDPVEVERGARGVFTGAPADAFRLATVLLHYRPDDHADTRIEDLLQVAADAMVEQPFVRFVLASARSRGDQGAAQRDENRRRHDYETILATHPDHVASLWQLARMDLASADATGRCERLLDRAQRQRPDCPQLHLLRAELLAALALDGLAVRAVVAAAGDDGHGNRLDHAQRRLALHDLVRGRVAAAAHGLGDLVARRNRLRDRLTLTAVLLRQGHRDAAVRSLETTADHHPFSSGPRLRLAQLLAAEGDPGAGLRHLRGWLLVCPDDDAAWVEAARLHGIAGQVEQQREALRTAIELNPNRKPERRLLEFLEAEQKPFYHAYVRDAAAILAADPGASADATTANDPCEYLLDQRVVAAYRNGTTSEYRHLILRVLNEEGSKRFAQYAVDHYWGEQRARLLQLVVHKPDGEQLRPRLLGAHATLPPLAAGDRLDIRFRIDDVAPSFFGDYFGLEHRFAHGPRCATAELIVLLDAGRSYGLQVCNGAPQPTRSRDATGRQVWRFDLRDIAREDAEDRQPAATETAPLVRISTYGSWNEFAAWWWNLIRNQTQVSPAIRRKVEELTAGRTTERDKIRAIYQFVTTEIRYEAWEFGVHGYKPYATPVIFDRRHGDCKDKSLLLNAMLSVVGIAAHPVLIHADQLRSTDDLRLPMVGHFNHCISYLPATASTPAMFLDGTATWHPLDILPEMDYGAAVLVVADGKGELQTIAWPAATRNLTRDSAVITLGPGGDAEVRYTSTPTGSRAVALREFLANEPGRRQENLEQLLKRDFGAIEIVSHEVSDLLDLGQPVRVEVGFRARRFAAQQGTGLILPGTVGMRELSGLTPTDTRRRALLLGVPNARQQTLTFRLPPGYAPLSIPPPTSLRPPFGTFELSWQRSGDELRVTSRLTLDRDRIPAAQYAAFKQFVTGVDQAARQVVVIEKRGSEVGK